MNSTKIQKLDNFIWVNLAILAFSLIFSLGIAQVVIILMTIAFAWKTILKPSKFYLSLLDLAVIAFFLTRLISIPVSIDFWVSFGSLKKTPFYIMTYLVLSRSLVDLEQKYFLKLFQVLVISAIVVSIYGTTKYFLGIQQRVTSTTSGYTTLAIFLSAIFSFTLGSGLFFDILKKKIFWVPALILMLLCLALTFARTQWLATFLVIFIAGIFRNRKILPIAIGAVLLLLLISPNLRNRATTLLNPMAHTSERNIIWKGAWEVFPDRFWFGHGIGTFHHIFPYKDQMQDKKVGRWHNDYIQAFMESGFVGLLVYFFLISATIKVAISRYKKFAREKNTILQGLVFGLLLALLTFYFQGLASGFFGDPMSSILFWIFVGGLWVFENMGNAATSYN